MQVESHHERLVPLSIEAAAALLDGLSSEEDALWPRKRWPAMRFDRPLGVGARGGHGFVRYRVIEYEPGRRVTFAFDPAIGLVGRHWFQVDELPAGVRMSHHIDAEARGRMRLGWPLAVRWLHDALVQDALDNASESGGQASRPFTPWVRLLRWLFA